MKTAWLTVFLLALVCAGLAQTPAPASTSDNVSGMYTFLQEGEFVQINVEDGAQVSGFVSRYGDTTGDKGAFLDHMFDKGELKGNHLHFKTRVVHGVSFEFDGNVERGDAKSTSDEGYRVLRGRLTEYKENENKKPTARSREITMKSFPQDAMAESPKKD